MKTVASAVVSVALVLVSLNSFAKEPRINGKKHPRREQVVGRAEAEKAKNNQAAVDGKITDEQAKKLDRQDNKIVRQEQAEAKANGGYITKAEQKQLNREENKVNRERNAIEKKDSAGVVNPVITPAAKN